MAGGRALERKLNFKSISQFLLLFSLLVLLLLLVLLGVSEKDPSGCEKLDSHILVMANLGWILIQKSMYLQASGGT